MSSVGETNTITVNAISKNVGFGIAPASTTERVDILGNANVSGVYKVGGVAGVNFGPSAVTSITVVGGIITAIS